LPQQFWRHLIRHCVAKIAIPIAGNM
jgi:hypothetical protein